MLYATQVTLTRSLQWLWDCSEHQSVASAGPSDELLQRISFPALHCHCKSILDSNDVMQKRLAMNLRCPRIAKEFQPLNRKHSSVRTRMSQTRYMLASGIVNNLRQ